MHFASDNASGASEKVLAAVTAANSGRAMPYGNDEWTLAAERRVAEIFGRACALFLVPTGTAANALALSALAPPWGAVFCHAHAHVMDSECGAPEFFTQGAKIVPVPGEAGKITPEGLARVLEGYPRGPARQVQPAVLSLSQATEAGTLYSCAEVAGLCADARAHGLGVHMDGARFANAVAALGCEPAELTWKAGVDVLSFGASKNGTLMCEAVIFFEPGKAKDFLVRRKRGGHTLSKSRYAGAQLDAYLEDGHWLDLAARANRQAGKLREGLAAIAGVEFPWPCEANEVFAIIPQAMDAALKNAGAVYYPWSWHTLGRDASAPPDRAFVRMVTSFETTDAEIAELLGHARQAATR